MEFVGEGDRSERSQTTRRLSEELAKIDRRLKAAYLDKLEGRIDEALWSEWSTGWQDDGSD